MDFPLPESGVASETDAILRDFMQRNMERGATQEDFEKQKEQLHQGASDAAANRLKSRLILGRIATEEKIQVENEDFSRVIMNEAMQTSQKPDQLVKELKKKDQSRIDRMRVDILMGKTMDRLLEKAERETAEATAWAFDSPENRQLQLLWEAAGSVCFCKLFFYCELRTITNRL